MKYRIIIAGSRTFGCYALLRNTMNEIFAGIENINKEDIVIVSGMANGADALGEEFDPTYYTDYLEEKYSKIYNL